MEKKEQLLQIEPQQELKFRGKWNCWTAVKRRRNIKKNCHFIDMVELRVFVPFVYIIFLLRWPIARQIASFCTLFRCFCVHFCDAFDYISWISIFNGMAMAMAMRSALCGPFCKSDVFIDVENRIYWPGISSAYKSCVKLLSYHFFFFHFFLLLFVRGFVWVHETFRWGFDNTFDIVSRNRCLNRISGHLLQYFAQQTISLFDSIADEI